MNLASGGRKGGRGRRENDPLKGNVAKKQKNDEW